MPATAGTASDAIGTGGDSDLMALDDPSRREYPALPAHERAAWPSRPSLDPTRRCDPASQQLRALAAVREAGRVDRAVTRVPAGLLSGTVLSSIRSGWIGRAGGAQRNPPKPAKILAGYASLTRPTPLRHTQKFHGQMSSRPVVSKSGRFRVAKRPPLMRAMAAIIPSGAVMGRPCRRAALMMSP